MKAYRLEQEQIERGKVAIGGFGYVWIEAHDLSAFNRVMDALNGHDALVAERDDLRAQRDDLIAALEMQANNYHYRDHQPLCWCRGEDRQPWPGCQDQPQCLAARGALAQVRGEGE